MPSGLRVSRTRTPPGDANVPWGRLCLPRSPRRHTAPGQVGERHGRQCTQLSLLSITFAFAISLSAVSVSLLSQSSYAQPNRTSQPHAESCTACTSSSPSLPVSRLSVAAASVLFEPSRRQDTREGDRTLRRLTHTLRAGRRQLTLDCT